MLYRRMGYNDVTIELLPDGRVGNAPGHCEQTYELKDDTLLFYDHRGQVSVEMRKSGRKWRGRLGTRYVELSETVPAASRSRDRFEFTLGILHARCYDLLKRALASVDAVFQGDICVINNSPDDPLEGIEGVRTPSVPLTFTQSMNYLHRIATERGSDVLFFMHDDAEADPARLPDFVSLVKEKWSSGEKWGVIFTNYDALAAFNMDCLDAVGPWDTTFTQYWADNDYYDRIEQAGFSKITTDGFGVKHLVSATLHSDPHRAWVNNIFRGCYVRYFHEKHGK